MATKERWYEVRVVDPKLDEEMGELAKRLNKNRAQVFHRAMRFYIEVKRRQLDYQENPEDPEDRLHMFLDNKKGKRIEFIED